MNIEPALYWIREREAIRVSKEAGEPRPWTRDRILHDYRFCNVRREDDRVTRWIDEHIRKPFGKSPHLWWMLCAARMINWPDTLEDLMSEQEGWPYNASEFALEMVQIILHQRTETGCKVFTGAYKIPAPHNGQPKYQWIAETVLGYLWRDRDDFCLWFTSGKATLQGTVERLRRYEGWGPFLSYQAVVDMRFTRLLKTASDVMNWAAAGPGTIRGLNRLHGRPVGTTITQGHALVEMREVYRLVRKELPRITIDFSDVPNVLCEVDKWLRGRKGEGPLKNRYQPFVPKQPKSPARFVERATV